MKQNLTILFDNLKKHIPAVLSGVPDQELHLCRPEYYLEDSREFKKDHLYIIQGEQLPRRAVVEKGSALICVGDSVYLPFYQERMGLILLTERVDYFRLFNMITEIYDRYDSWSEELGEILETTASIQEMVACSRKIFENPMFVLNSDFHYLVHSDHPDLALTSLEETDREGRDLSPDNFWKFIDHHEMSTQIKEPMLINLLDTSTLNVNLFENNQYIGCLTIDYQNRSYQDSDKILALCLARRLESALKKYSANLTTEKNALCQAVKDLLQGYQSSLYQKRILDTARFHEEHICLKIVFDSQLTALPVTYLCNAMENSFKGGLFFSYDGGVVGIIQDLSPEEIEKSLSASIQSKHFHAGISDVFKDMDRVKLYYLQACAALENGQMFHPRKSFYYFQDYALTELLINALGNLPIELYYSEGLKRLLKHDQNSSVSYIDTLRTYLDNNMSITKTTRLLYINRSTFLERLTRIKRELNSDLQNAEERLMLQIILKAMELNQKIQDHDEK